MGFVFSFPLPCSIPSHPLSQHSRAQSTEGHEPRAAQYSIPCSTSGLQQGPDGSLDSSWVWLSICTMGNVPLEPSSPLSNITRSSLKILFYGLSKDSRRSPEGLNTLSRAKRSASLETFSNSCPALHGFQQFYWQDRAHLPPPTQVGQSTRSATVKGRNRSTTQVFRSPFPLR